MGPDTNFALAIEQMVEASWQKRLTDLEPRPLAWLALLPAWTEALARACSFPAKDLETFLREARAAGLCERRTRDGQEVFAVPVAERAKLLTRLRAQQGQEFLLTQAATLGPRVQAYAESANEAVAPTVRRWAELAARLKGREGRTIDLRPAAHWLDRQVTALIEQQQTGEALAWVRTGQAVGDLFGGPLETTARLGERRLEIAYRRIQDARLLEAFLPRQEQIEAVERLLWPPQPPWLSGLAAPPKPLTTDVMPVWALHYLGVGGVGKTMLLRYITATLAARYGYVTSRIDFDYISPQYPTRKPGQLLLELADELRVYGDVRSHLSSFRSAVDALHEKFSGPGVEPDPVKALQSDAIAPLFRSVIDSFARVLSALDRKVLLILDTCEELAKYRGSGHRLPSVEATLYILQTLHRRRPEVRVVFAGRRRLAQGGAGWHADDEHLAHQHLPVPQPYLALHLIRGFTRAEAEQFIVGKKQVRAAPEVREAVLAGSREVIAGVVVHQEASHASPADASDADRYNPFDLALYADWLLEEPDLARDVIVSGEDDPYIERRIRARLQEPLQRLLPAVALLGRFDERMLRPLLDEDREAARSRFRELADQEWIDYQRDEDLAVTFLGVNPNLLVRLRRYYRRDPDRRRVLQSIQQRLAPHLAALIRGQADQPTTLQHLGTDHLDAALRLLSAPEAARLWTDVELRIPAEVGWGWALAVTSRLLGADGAIGEPAHPLRAVLLATQAAATLHQQLEQNVAGLWEAAAEVAHRHPDVESREPLLLRCALGQVQAHARLAWQRPADASPSVSALWGQLSEARRRLLAWLTGAATLSPGLDRMPMQLIASYGAALAACLDAAEKSDAVLEPRYLDLGESEYEQLLAVIHQHRALASLLMLSEARKPPLRGIRPVMRRKGSVFFEFAAQVAPPEVDDPHRWFDWVAPRAFQAYARLLWLRAMPPKREPEREPEREPDAKMNASAPAWDVMLGTWLPEALQQVADIDGERLVAQILRVRLAHERIPLEEVEAIAKRLRYDPSRRPTSYVHTVVPPLVVVLAEAYTAWGQGDRAVQLLGDHSSTATRTGQDDPLVRAVTEGFARVARRMRSRLLLPYDDNPTHEAFAARWLTGQGIFGADPDEIPERRVFEPPPGGPRTRAWRQLERAELLALTDPGAAWEALGEAGNALQDLGDVVGRFQARVLTELASFRAGRRATALGTGLLAEAYRDLRQVDDRLPDWNDLKRQVEAAWRRGDDLPDWNGQVETSWQDWFFRLATAMLLPQLDRHDRDDVISLGQWLERIYGDQIPDELRLLIPDELPESAATATAAQRGTTVPGAATVGAPAPVAAPAQGRGGFDWKNLGWVLFGLVIALGLIAVGYVAFQGLLVEGIDPVPFPDDPPEDENGLPDFGNIALLIGLIFLLLVGGVRAYRALRSRVEDLLRVWLAASDAEVAINQADGPRADVGAAVQMVYRLKPWLPANLLTTLLPFSSLFQLLVQTLSDRYLLFERLGTTTVASAEQQQPYAQDDDIVPPDLRRSLRLLVDQLGERSMGVRLKLDRASLGSPWEAWMAWSLAHAPPAEEPESESTATEQETDGDASSESDASPTDPLTIAGTLRMWRAVPRTGKPRTERYAAGDWEDGGVRFIGPRRSQMTASAWTLFATPETLAVGSGYEQPAASKSAGTPPKLLHVVGEVIETSAGLRWHVPGDAQPSAETVGRSGELLDAATLAAWKAMLVIVQQEPVGTLTRTTYDREQAARLRRFAGEVAGEGASVVLALPGLPEPVSRAVLDAIAGHLTEPPTLKRMLDLVHTVRTTIADGDRVLAAERPSHRSVEQPEAFRELALDVCLYHIA